MAGYFESSRWSPAAVRDVRSEYQAPSAPMSATRAATATPEASRLDRETDIQDRERAAECDHRRDRRGADEDALRVKDRVATAIGKVVPRAELREQEQRERRVEAGTRT